jgi:molecular chaperone DnaK
MDIHVLQGERELAMDNVSLGQFELSDIPRAPKGVIKVEVAFEADVDGILHVAARDLLTEEEVQVKLAAAKHLDTSEIEDLTRDAAANEAQDRKVRDLVQAKIRAENLLDAVEGTNDQASQPLARGIAHSVARLKSALKQGMAVEIERAISELRDLLAHSGPNEDVEALQETSAVR